MKEILNNHAKKIRFIIVGICNTAIDFLVFVLLISYMPNIPANFISTSCGMVFSFISNKRFTFGDKAGSNLKQVINFIIVTVFALWVIQPVIIYITQPAIGAVTHDYILSSFIAKALATLVSLIWNYIAYSRFVFRDHGTTS